MLLPAGTTDRYLGGRRARAHGAPRWSVPLRLVAGGTDFVRRPGDAGARGGPGDDGGRAEAAVEAGIAAVDGLVDGPVGLGAAALRDGMTTDVGELVPAYVALPRGVTDAVSGMAWSPDLR